MKKISLILTIALILSLLAGCAGIIKAMRTQAGEILS